MLLEAANGDPLRAMEIEAGLSQEWWERYLVYRRVKAEVEEEQLRKAARRSRK